MQLCVMLLARRAENSLWDECCVCRFHASCQQQSASEACFSALAAVSPSLPRPPTVERHTRNVNDARTFARHGKIAPARPRAAPARRLCAPCVTD